MREEEIENDDDVVVGTMRSLQTAPHQGCQFIIFLTLYNKRSIKLHKNTHFTFNSQQLGYLIFC